MDFAWVAQDDSNAIQNSIVDAKGDLIAATANDTPARLAVGANGETLVADSSTSTGLRYQGSQAAGKNVVINGNFDIWQRGTSFNVVNATAYTADRFVATGVNNMTISRQTTGIPAGSQYCLRMASNFTNSVADFFQYIETANVVPLQGQTVTLSALVRKNASNTAGAYVYVAKSATVDAGSGATWTIISSVVVPTGSLPTGTGSADWFKTSLNVAIPNDGTANSLRVYISTSAQIVSGAYMEIAQVQLELGSVATSFARAGATIQGELDACMRYYYRSVTNGTASTWFASGFAFNSTRLLAFFKLPVRMRVNPTSIETSGTAADYWVVVGTTVSTATSVPTLDTSNWDNVLLNLNTTGLTAGQGGLLGANSTNNAYIGFNAEL
jgi:hypothetical protein